MAETGVAGLQIRLFGQFEVILDGAEVTSFETGSVRALLAYLASRPGLARARPVVAEMLWPDRPEGAALSNLRHALSVLRRALAEHDSPGRFVIADRGTVAISASNEVWVDLVEFERLAKHPADGDSARRALEEAVALYRGPFLDGLRVAAGAEWDEWVLVTSERARRQLAGALRRLADHHERAGTWGEAISTARQLTEVDPWDEKGHRRLIRLLARSGESPQALAHFQDYEERLLAEIGALPAPETAALVDQIRAGDLARASEIEVSYPAFLAEVPTTAPPLFVGRQRELGQLDTHLEQALTGRGGVVFVAGEAGSGKTVLVEEFMRRATDISQLLVARGRCNAFAGMGDPYLPFREVLSLLCGDVKSGYTAGALDREQATRLWEAIPHTARLVAEVGPSLVGVMVNGGLLVEHADQALPGAEWIKGLQDLVETRSMGPPGAERSQPALFDELTAVLDRLSITRPLLLVIDDLQWADQGSIALLWHLARRVGTMRVLVVGVFRIEEVTPSLEEILRDLRVTGEDNVVELANDRGFIDDFLDSEPNMLDEEFRDRLFAYTGGQPLFTVELVRGMQERAEIRRDKTGVWHARGSLNWDRLPGRVEAVIAHRIAQLPQQLQEDLSVASVQGEEFVAEVVAAIRSDEGAPARLSSEHSSRQRLIDPSGVERIDGRLAARHRFRHVLFQRYLYDRLDEVERMRLHEATGRALEDLYRDQPELPVVDLAEHYDQAGLADEASGYLYQAGERAIRMAAPDEAVGLLKRALELLRRVPESTDRDERELDILVALASSLMAVRGYAAPEAQAIGPRVRELCDRLGPSTSTAVALLGLVSVLSVRGLYRESQALCEEASATTQVLGDSALVVPTKRMLGYNRTWMGELEAGHEDLRTAHELYDPQAHSSLTYAFGGATGPEALVWDAFNTLSRGYLDQAFQLADRGIELARNLGHPFTLCHALAIGGTVVRHMAGDYVSSSPFIDEVEAIARAEHFPFYEVAVRLYRGQSAGRLGRPKDGIEAVRTGLQSWETMGVGAFRGWFLGDIAEFELARGNLEGSFALTYQALEEVEASGEVLTLLHLKLLHGKLCGLDDRPSAVGILEEVIGSAETMGARHVELRAATELALLHERNDQLSMAREVLEPIYSWFTEGLDTPYLRAAKEVLDRL